MIRPCNWLQITKDIDQKDWQVKIYADGVSPLLKTIKKINFYGDFRIEILDGCTNISPSTDNEVLYVELNRDVFYVLEHKPLEEV